MEYFPKELILEIIDKITDYNDIYNFLHAYVDVSIVFSNLLKDNKTFEILIRQRFPLLFDAIKNVINDDNTLNRNNKWLSVYAKLAEYYHKNQTKLLTFEGLFKEEGLYEYEEHIFNPIVPDILYRAAFKKYFPEEYDAFMEYGLSGVGPNKDPRRSFHLFLLQNIDSYFMYDLSAGGTKEELFKFLYSNDVNPAEDYSWEYLINMISQYNEELLRWTLDQGERTYIDNDEFLDAFEELEVDPEIKEKYKKILDEYAERYKKEIEKSLARNTVII